MRDVVIYECAPVGTFVVWQTVRYNFSPLTPMLREILRREA